MLTSPKDSTVHKLNQCLRGHNYLWVDFIMTAKLQDIDSFNLIMRFFKLNLDFLVSYLTKIQDNFNEYIKIISIDKEVEEMDLMEAYYFSFFEIFDTIYTIFGNYERLDGFFKNNEDIMKEHYGVSTHRDCKKMFRQELSKHLLEIKGFEIIDNIVKMILTKEGCVPFSFLSPFTHLIEGVIAILVSSFKELLLENLLKIG